MRQSSSKKIGDKPAKPHPDFPLFPHATKRWAKKIRGEFHFFGPWRDPEGALEEWLRVKDELLAGRKPRPKNNDGAVTVELVVNAFLTHKERLRDNNEIQPRTFNELKLTGIRIAQAFGKQRSASDLQPTDFAELRSTLAKTLGAVSLGNEIQRVRSFFKWALEDGLMDKPIRFGTSFRKPSAKTIRLEQAEIGPRDLSSGEIRQLMESANIPMRAMILLGTNCGLGNNDVARLLKANVDLKTGWLVFPRPKTGVPRRAKLWPETIDAIETALSKRPEPKDPEDADLIFLTKMRHSWAKRTPGNNPVSLMFKKLLKEGELYRPGIGFYSLRRTFETIAGETLDQPAVDLVMGHTPHANDMAARYRQRISDERLEAVAEYMQRWLFPKRTKSATKTKNSHLATSKEGAKKS